MTLHKSKLWSSELLQSTDVLEEHVASIFRNEITSTLKMEATCSLEMKVSNYKIMTSQTQKTAINNHCYKNLKSYNNYIIMTFLYTKTI
jgi:hypothetical protein